MELIAKLFGVFLQIGCFSIGGGYAVISLIQNQIVGKYGWLTEKTFGDIITISQMTPGAAGCKCFYFCRIPAGGSMGGQRLLPQAVWPEGLCCHSCCMYFLRKKETPSI